ncbi:MAG: cupredoxin domain-containing protein [Thermoleophilaceae bacterium]
MRRGVAAGVIVALLAAATAWADETITARPVNSFGQAVTTIDQGEKVTFRNSDIAGHDVTAAKTGDDGKPLFRSELISPGASGPVKGTEYLTSGTYPFICTIHPGMEATLEVTSAGTPVPRPQPGVTVKVVSRDLQRVVDSGKLKLKVRSSKASLTVGARATAGKSSIALGSKKLKWDGGEDLVKLKLSDSARKALSKKKSAKLIATVTADHGGGHTERSTAQRTLD